MKRHVLTVWAAALVLPLVALAQGKPDLSGTWAMDLERSESAMQGGPVGPVTVVIKQTPEELVIETRRGENVDSVTYKVAPNEKSAGPMEGVPASRAYWDGVRLVTETARPVQGQTVTTKEVRYLNGPTEMMVESILEVEHGYTLRGVKTYGMARDVFKKAGT